MRPINSNFHPSQRLPVRYFLDPATGAADDWAKAVAGIKYTFTPELKGPFFIVPTSDIEVSFEEFWNGMVAMVEEIEVIEGLE